MTARNQVSQMSVAVAYLHGKIDNKSLLRTWDTLLLAHTSNLTNSFLWLLKYYKILW